MSFFDDYFENARDNGHTYSDVEPCPYCDRVHTSLSWLCPKCQQKKISCKQVEVATGSGITTCTFKFYKNGKEIKREA